MGEEYRGLAASGDLEIGVIRNSLGLTEVSLALSRGVLPSLVLAFLSDPSVF